MNRQRKKILMFHPSLAPYRLDQFNSLNELFDLMKAGKIDPLVSETFPLARAGDAIAKLEAREAVGKLVVTMD